VSEGLKSITTLFKAELTKNLTSQNRINKNLKENQRKMNKIFKLAQRDEQRLKDMTLSQKPIQ